MKYTIMQYNRHFLDIVKKGVTKEELVDFGEVDRPIYADYEGTKECGYILKKEQTKFYAFLEK